jgi:regulatory protein RepA
MKTKIALKTVIQKLHEGMYQGNMHECLRDCGSMAGGYSSSGYLKHGEMAELKELAIRLSINKKQGEITWEEGVDFGKKKPLIIDLDNYEPEGKALDWEDEIGGGALANKSLIDVNWLEDIDIPGPCRTNVEDIRFYLSNMFQAEEHVNFVLESYEIDGKNLPTKGVSMLAGKLLEDLDKTNSVEDTFGTHKEHVGGWIRFNPLDGTGAKDVNVTSYRYALVESDVISIGKQYSIMRELQLPIKMLVNSAGKSVHALVKIEADTFDEYRKRVDFLYEVCKKNSLAIDRQNRNPSRLSRMPGLTRNGKRQYIIANDIGMESWVEWKAYIEDSYDDLPEMDSLEDDFFKDEELAPILIDGVLRQGHKLLISGPSKAGKSLWLIELCIAIAERQKWLGWQCAQGRVLYVNLELDERSCRKRFRDVYKEMKIKPNNVGNIDIWNLRGKSAPMDKLAPKLIRRALKKRYLAVIIDPIYKVITGDENNADHMAKFCNQFDLICTQLGSATIYCHHHSKGSQGQKKSADRSSGSGVFARDPDAIIDLIQLDITEAMSKTISNDLECKSISAYMDKTMPSWRFQDIAQDDMIVAKKLISECQRLIGEPCSDLSEARFEGITKAKSVSAWRVEGTLREFASFDAKRCFFMYPIHVPDHIGVLEDAIAEGETKKISPKEFMEKKKSDAKMKKETNHKMISDAFGVLFVNDEPVTIDDMASYLATTDRSLRRWIIGHNEYEIESGIIRRKQGGGE